LKKVKDLSTLKSTSSTGLKQELNSYIVDSFTFLQQIQEKLDASLEISGATFTDFGILLNNSRFYSK
jgi:hypothetical protein